MPYLWLFFAKLYHNESVLYFKYLSIMFYSSDTSYSNKGGHISGASFGGSINSSINVGGSINTRIRKARKSSFSRARLYEEFDLKESTNQTIVQSRLDNIIFWLKMVIVTSFGCSVYGGSYYWVHDNSMTFRITSWILSVMIFLNSMVALSCFELQTPKYSWTHCWLKKIQVES